MRFESFTAKLRAAGAAAKAFLGLGKGNKVYDGVKPPPKPVLAPVAAEGVAKRTDEEIKAMGAKGPSYTPPSPSPATLRQRAQKVARRITRRNAA